VTEDRRCSIEDLRWNSGDRRCSFVEHDVGVIQYGVGVMKTDRRWRNGERRWSFVGLDVAVTVNDVGVPERRLSSGDRRWGIVGLALEYRGTDCLVSGAVEVSVWVDSGIVDVGAGSAGLFCECWVVDGAEEDDWSSIGNVAAEGGSIKIGGGAEQRKTTEQRRAA